MHTANKKFNSINEPSEVDETIHYINNHEQGHLSSLSKTTTTKKDNYLISISQVQLHPEIKISADTWNFLE